MNTTNQPWNLNSFIDALIYELDRAHDTLSVKGTNRKLTYMVKDLDLDLQLFPEFDGDAVYFTTAQPGDIGASKISVKLGSIRDHQIQEIAKKPVSHADIALEETQLPLATRKILKKLGIHSAEDLRHTIEDRGIDLNIATDGQVDYQQLTDILHQAHRQHYPPTVASAKFDQVDGQPVLTLQGKNLAVTQSTNGFPAALLDGHPIPMLTAREDEIQFQLDPQQLHNRPGQLKVALDPYAVVAMKLAV